jgi:hypothetical protein
MRVKSMDDFRPSHREGLGVGPEAQVTDWICEQFSHTGHGDTFTNPAAPTCFLYFFFIGYRTNGALPLW